MIFDLLNFFAKRLKGDSFSLDKRIPLGYLLAYAFQRGFMVFRGWLLFPTKGGSAFIGSKTVIKSKSKIKFIKPFTVYNNCYIDALSSHGLNIGAGCSVGKFTTIECTGSLSNLGVGLTLHDYVAVGTHSYFGCAGGIEIGSNTIMGNFVSLHSENHVYSDPDILIREQGVTREGIKLGENCWIGAKVTVLDGVVLGNNSIVAAGSVVLRGSYPDNGIYGGVPAKLIGKVPF